MILSLKEFQDNLTDDDAKFNLIEEIRGRLKSEYNLTPKIGAEIEFYLNKPIDLDYFTAGIGRTVKQEKGPNQYEIDVNPLTDLKEFILSINNAREQITRFSSNNDFGVSFLPKLFTNDYGSSMHFHLNFLEDNEIEKYANILCNFAANTLDFFLPSSEDYARLDSKFMSPTHICWGGNNRTCMIRIPDVLPKRLEHRLAGADINPILPIYAMLASILSGLQEPDKLKNFPKIFGNAYDAQYQLEKI